MNDDKVAAATRRYSPLLIALRTSTEKLLGPLLWNDRPDSSISHRGGRDLVRVGPVCGTGLDPRSIELERLRTQVNQNLAEHGFERVDVLTGSSSGWIVASSTDVTGATLRIEVKAEAIFWVDVPL